MSISTVCPSPSLLRRSLEQHILDLYESDGTTLKPSSAWPGYYLLPDRTKIPAVFVTGQEMVPSAWKVNGVEMTIDDVPADIVDLGSYGALAQVEIWAVRFTNYGSPEGVLMPASLRDIRRRLARAFPRDQVTYMGRTEATFEAITARISGAVLNPPIP
jgi:hypothetical protein